MLIEHSEFQDQLVRGLAHQMNNILTLFHGHLGLLLGDESLSASTVESLQVIKSGAKAASELIDRTQTLVRPSAMVWRALDLGECVRRLRPAFADLRGTRTVLHIDAPAGLPHVWGDLGRIQTAILELVRNACEATSEGGVVEIALHAEKPVPSASAAKQAIRWLTLQVRDDGPGIPPELREKIFAPFFTTKTRNAVGLGLTVTQGIAQQLGGALRFRSRPGETLFELLLPSQNDPQ